MGNLSEGWPDDSDVCENPLTQDASFDSESESDSPIVDNLNANMKLVVYTFYALSSWFGIVVISLSGTFTHWRIVW